MIIGFDGSRVFTANRTGTENYSYQLLKHLARIDLTNTYNVFLRPRGQALRGMSLPSNFNLITLSYPRLWTQFGLAKQTFIDPLDVLFVPSHTLPLIRDPNLPTVLTVHDLGAEYLPKTHQFKQRLYLNFMTHYQLNSATRLIAVSQATKADLVKKIDIPSDKISVIYEGYNNDLFLPVKGQNLTSVLSSYNLKPKTYFLFVGTIQPRKNLERLIKAYKTFLTRGAADGRNPVHLPQLILAGSKGWLSDQIYQLPKSLGIEDSVKFLGYVPDEKLPALYSGAKAFVFPSLFEGFGLPILEAMACGTPVITSNVSSMPEVAGEAAILIDPYSGKEIAQALLDVTMNHERTNQLIRLGLNQVSKFSWEKCAKETLKILQNYFATSG